MAQLPPRRPVRRLLVANRGEIARRILRGAHELGLETVAVYSDADRDAPHVREADQAVRLGPAPSAESYLDPDRILGALFRTGADTIHPGYGFLAENAAFREAIEQAGVRFIGPSAEAIRRMGSKTEARRLATSLRIPVVPGLDSEALAAPDRAARAEALGFPLLIKASGGGGGRGMRVVRRAAELEEAIDAARSEAELAFSDGALFCERLVERARHIEVQVLGDGLGRAWHLFERECSIQRRHQKVIEEAPAPGLCPTLRETLCREAVRIAEAIRYEGAGTVEFLVTPRGDHFFLEMNTRLQVEHPVTEAVTGLDLVTLSLRLALGEPLGLDQREIGCRGHAIEARLSAEVPARDYAPSTGRILACSAERAEGVRYDGFLEVGAEIGVHYDALLVKTIAHGQTRPEAIRRLQRALRGLVALGVETNREQLLQVLQHPAFWAGDLDTNFLAARRHALMRDPDREAWRALAAVWVATAQTEKRRAAHGLLPGLAPGFRNSRLRCDRLVLEDDTGPLEVSLRPAPAGQLEVAVEGTTHIVRTVHAAAPALRLEVDGVQRTGWIAAGSGQVFCQLGPRTFVFQLPPRLPPAQGAARGEGGGLCAEMPGQVRQVLCEVGQTVAEGDPVVVLESMKTETVVRAPRDGVVERIPVAVGDTVDRGTELVVLG